MLTPSLIKMPSITLPSGSANDYACGVYNGNKNFSCSPYGSLGNIDGHLNGGSSGWGPAVLGAVIGVVGSVSSALLT